MISASILRCVQVKETPSKVNPAFWPAMREGLNFVRGNKMLVTMASCVGIWQMCSQGATVVQILFAIHQLGLSERGESDSVTWRSEWARYSQASTGIAW